MTGDVCPNHQRLVEKIEVDGERVCPICDDVTLYTEDEEDNE